MDRQLYTCGYAAIIGRPNAGKSTLMNRILNMKLSIVSKKPQTTRKRVLGIYNSDDTQIIFYDTPGMIRPHYELQSRLMKFVDESVQDVDVIVLIVDAAQFRADDPYRPERDYLSHLTQPKIAVINKIDLSEQSHVQTVTTTLIQSEEFTHVLPISALTGMGVEGLIDLLKTALPEHPPMYDPDQITEHPERFFVSELIRETIFHRYADEIPYSTEVLIEEFKERETGKDYIRAVIWVERSSQKGILIGAGGAALKQLGARARKEIEEFLDRPVYLELFVKVKSDWRDQSDTLNQLGY